VIPLVIVPFHDPRWLANTVENLERQTAQVRVVLVTNGKAEGFEHPRYQTTPSGPSHAEAVNAGVAWARDGRDFTHAILMDSDDYYGPHYVEQTLRHLERADFVGKRSIYTKFTDEPGIYRFDREGRSFLFATIGFEIRKFVPVANVHNNCRDWTDRMVAAGHVGADTGAEHYLYLRHGDNAHWRAPDVFVKRGWGTCTHYRSESIGSLGHGTPVAPPGDDDVFAALRDS
jgi:hypothetical protein